MDDLDARQKPSLPAWKLREQMKQKQAQPSGGSSSSDAIPKRSYRRASEESMEDPSLPPAFRAAFARQRRKEVDDFMSMSSVHSTKSHLSTLMTATPTSNDSDSFGDSDSFDGHDSFASLGDGDDDDEAIREGKNQLARQTVECNRSTTNRAKVNEFRFKKGGLNGTPLDFIAE